MVSVSKIDDFLPTNMAPATQQFLRENASQLDMVNYPFAPGKIYAKLHTIFGPYRGHSIDFAHPSMMQIGTTKTSIGILDAPYKGASNNLYFLVERYSSSFPYVQKDILGASWTMPTEMLPKFFKDLEKLGHHIY